MRKKLLGISIFMMLITGCFNNQTIIEKKDESKAYIYIDEADDFLYFLEYDLETFNILYDNYNRIYSKKNMVISYEGLPMRNESIKININSSDGDNVQSLMDAYFEEGVKSVNYGSDVYSGIVSAQVFVLFDTMETSDFISFSTLKQGFQIAAGSSGIDVETYVFDKKDGHLLTKKELFNYFNISEQEVYDKLTHYTQTVSGEIRLDTKKYGYQSPETTPAYSIHKYSFGINSAMNLLLG